ncbi:uncharacterized protein LOC127750538 [Frankliniella occidentalis]|uniref:Uncharacterized protein LOC127750538 n=1 Tax=Frankliniella occidentalis TaxID=133901 RepID=A0A9C6X3E2_FRAOC|nr:uncharacterized protein LOC127750538 [Frankliniella occidentalis]
MWPVMARHHGWVMGEENCPVLLAGILHSGITCWTFTGRFRVDATTTCLESLRVSFLLGDWHHCQRNFVQFDICELTRLYPSHGNLHDYSPSVRSRLMENCLRSLENVRDNTSFGKIL